MRAGPRRWPLARTPVAAALVTLAVALPCGYWFVAEGRAVAGERAAILRQPSERATRSAAWIASLVDRRLSALAERENERPYYHYQNLYADPRGASEGPAVVPSPLADGESDPLIVTHFQVDAEGGVTVPTVNPDLALLSDKAGRGALALRRVEREVLPFIEATTLSLALLPAPAPAASSAAPPDPSPPQYRGAPSRALAEVAPRGASNSPAIDPRPNAPRGNANAPAKERLAPAVQEQRISSQVYLDNVHANQVYWDIQTKKGRQLAPARPELPPPAPLPTSGEVVVRVGPLIWHTIAPRGEPILVALRRVETPDGVRVQGFEVDREGLASLLVDEDRRVSFLPGPASAPGQASVALGARPWHVSVDFAPQLAAAALEARALGDDFAWRFGVGALLAALAGLSVVLMIGTSERLSRRRVRFAASAAHELRTPLAGLRMYGEMLAEGLGNPERRQVYARRVASEADRLGRVVSNVLDFTRLERGSLAVSCSAGDVGAVVREVVARLEPTVAAAGASLLLSGSPAGVVARFDRDALEQILSNLIDNAEKYSRHASVRAIEISVGPSAEGGALIEVSDRGPGVGARVARRLFKPFSRGEGADLPAGLGLGLALARVLVSAQGGRLRYLPREGGGARFLVELPPVASGPKPAGVPGIERPDAPREEAPLEAPEPNPETGAG